MDNTQEITLNKDECKAVVEIIDILSGGNAHNVWGDNPTLDNPLIAAAAKIYKLAGDWVPECVGGDREY